MSLDGKKIEGIVIDFDGTLAGATHEVSPRVRKSIAKAKEKVKISLCTGRPYKFVAALARELGLSTLHVAEGGGRVVTSAGEVLWERLIPEATLRGMYALSVREGLSIVAQVDGDDVIPWQAPSDGTFPKMAHALFQHTEREKVQPMLAEFARQFHDIHGILSHYQDGDQPVKWMIDVTAAGANKQHALLHLAQLEGLDLKKFMAIGDGYNDFPLLAACGFKIAMGNAHPELKAIADYIAPSVDEDGVAHVIEKFVLNK